MGRNRLLYRLSRQRPDANSSSCSRRCWCWQRQAQKFDAATRRLSSRRRRRRLCVDDNISDRIGRERTNERTSERASQGVAVVRWRRLVGEQQSKCPSDEGAAVDDAASRRGSNSAAVRTRLASFDAVIRAPPQLITAINTETWQAFVSQRTSITMQRLAWNVRFGYPFLQIHSLLILWRKKWHRHFKTNYSK